MFDRTLTMSVPDRSLDRRVAVVTGSARVSGRAIAETLAGKGAVVVVNSRDPEASAAKAGSWP